MRSPRVTYVDADEDIVQQYRVEQGDFYVLRGNGNRDYIGTGGLLREVPPKNAIFSDLLFRLRFVCSGLADGFMPYLWQSPCFLRRLQSKAKSGSGLWKIGKRDIENELFPWPSEDEQREIVSMLDCVGRHLMAIEAQTEALTRLKASLLQNLLTGKVRIKSGLTTQGAPG